MDFDPPLDSSEGLVLAIAITISQAKGKTAVSREEILERMAKEKKRCPGFDNVLNRLKGVGALLEYPQQQLLPTIFVQ